MMSQASEAIVGAAHTVAVVETCAAPLYLEIPLAWDERDERYQRELGAVRIEITADGHYALTDAVGECPCCGKAVAEGVCH